MSCCCGKNNKNYYTHAYCNDDCNRRDQVCCDNDCDNDNDYGRGNHDDCDNKFGISCPFQNNNDCLCEDSLRKAAARLTNQRVIIHVDGCKMCVVIVGIGKCFLKTVNPCTQKIVYFNFNRINNIEDVLPRCY